MRFIYYVLIAIGVMTGIINCNGRSSDIKVDKPESLKIEGSTYSYDSLKLIRSLYQGVDTFSAKNYSDFSYSINYNSSRKVVTIKSTKEIEKHIIDYYIELRDTAGVFKMEEFSPEEESYKYLRSYFLIDGKKIDLTKLTISNLDEKVSPSLLWYNDEFGISAKYYNINGQQIFLLRGLDLYCNGRQCTGYQLFVIRKQGQQVVGNVYYFSGLYPYSFENTFLFDSNGDSNPELYIPKSTVELKGKDDFTSHELLFNNTN